MVRIIRRPTYIVAELQGDVDTFNGPELRNSFNSILDGRRHDLIIDLEDVDFIDAHGLEIIFWVFRELQLVRGSLRVVVSKPHLRKLFEITGLRRKLSLYASQPDAVRDLKA